MKALHWNVIIECDRLARKNHVYKHDPAGKDRWRSFHNVIDVPWYGDCDDLAATTLMLLHLSGAPENTLVRVMVDSIDDKVDKIDHFIGACRDSSGLWWLVGDTFGKATRLADTQHQILQFSPVDGGTEWLPFKGFTDGGDFQ